MTVEWFLKLKEIDSLTKMRSSELKVKSEEANRLIKLNDQKNAKLSQTAQLKQDLVSLKDEIAQVEKKLATASEQKQRLIDLGGDDKKIANFNSEIEQLEETGLLLLDKEESINVELNDIKTFLTGLEKTIAEIQSEVSEEETKIKKSLENIDLRLNLLMDELPDNFKALLKKTTAKNLAHGPFTRVDQGSCYFCRFKISRIDESEIDMQRELKTCPQCSRIFLPYGS